MVKLVKLQANLHEVVMDGGDIYFSYSQPIAFSSKLYNKFYITTKKYSNTTTRHCKWLQNVFHNAILVDQDELDLLIKEDLEEHDY